ncbi:MAG: FAD-binding oxidoreductase, partial [Gammaproteobacteria bacterium]|nr:FAD-binding oxidoreductase [Gammaproteobacteria bacterium]
KDNTGYDLKRLFLGAEGTLGIITAAALKLFPKPREVMTALVAAPSAAAATTLLAEMRTATADSVTSFEYMHRNCLDLVLEHIDGVSDPFEAAHQHYVLIELSSGRADGQLAAIAEQGFAEAFERGLLNDAVIAQNETQARQLWRLRETIPEAQKRAGAAVKHDVSVPVSQVARFMDEATAICAELVPESRVIRFGHLGDGNVHFNLSQAADGDGANLIRQTDTLVERVHELAVRMNGSFSAEHGIGRLKLPEMHHFKSSVELDMMRAIKRAFDPNGLMNPGKVVD